MPETAKSYTAKPYIRAVNYYETDKMGIVHHSNYIRWFEEARLDFLKQIGLPYEETEKQNILIPVCDVSCEYKSPSRFGDEVAVYTTLTHFNGIRVKFSYEIFLNSDSDKRLIATGTSTHCFVDEKNLLPLNMKKHDKNYYEKLLLLLKQG